MSALQENPLDQHGQPIRLFRFNAQNNIQKAIDQLSGICCGILADGVVSEKEAKFFADWIRTTAAMEPVWPFTDILTRVERIFSDGICSDEEREELKEVMQTICGQKAEADPGATFSSDLPLDRPEPELIVFPQRVFTITGKFAYGTRSKVMEAIEQKGGVASDSHPTKSSNYLVIGVFASRDWINTNYGRKIERAVQLRESSSGITIISEECWRKWV